MSGNVAIVNLTCYYLNIYYCRVMRHFEFFTIWQIRALLKTNSLVMWIRRVI